MHYFIVHIVKTAINQWVHNIAAKMEHSAEDYICQRPF